MLGLGIASSHAGALFVPKEYWPAVYAAMPDYMKDSQPHTAKTEPERIDDYIARKEKAFAVLRAQLEAYKPDALIAIGDDQAEVFNKSNNPTLCVFTGDEVVGTTDPIHMKTPPEASRITIKIHSRLAKHVLKQLIKKGFDAANVAEMVPVGKYGDRGVSHMLARPMPKLVPKLDIPVIPIFLNEYFPPLPDGKRCWDLGVALQEICDAIPERIALFASGGLSHDPGGPRAGWVDEPLDRWVLERIEQNRGEELCRLFTFDSATLRGGTGEIRAWITAAGACRRPATVIDYFASHYAKTGCAFAYWPPEKSARAKRKASLTAAAH